MIDTVILSIPTTKIIVLDESAHGVLPWDLQARGRGFEKYVKNPSERDKASGLYFPRLTGYKRGSTKMVKIEFSAPKLLFNNNLDELADKQFAAVIDALQDRLVRLAVRIQQVDLERADVAGVHYSKNVELTGGYTSEYVIGELGKINLNKRFDLTRARYMNDGQSLCAYSTSHSFVIYDKVADLKRGSKRAIDREQTDYQMSLFAPLKKAHEILRFEVRLSQRRKMINVLKTLGLGDNPTFRDVFSVKTSQAVLMHYWDILFSTVSERRAFGFRRRRPFFVAASSTRAVFLNTKISFGRAASLSLTRGWSISSRVPRTPSSVVPFTRITLPSGNREAYFSA
jgi:hypothetical protein